MKKANLSETPLFHMNSLLVEEIILVAVKKNIKIIIILILLLCIISFISVFTSLQFQLINAEKDAEHILKNQYYDICEKISSEFNIRSMDYSILFFLNYGNEYKKVTVDLKSKDSKGRYNKITIEEYLPSL